VRELSARGGWDDGYPDRAFFDIYLDGWNAHDSAAHSALFR
jgi:hypothetical protein